MDGNQDLRARIRESTFLRTFGGAFPDLTAAGGDLGQTFRRLGELAGAAGLRPTAGDQASISFVVGPVEARAWTLRLTAGGCAVSDDRADQPDLEVLLAEDTWLAMARGELLPLEAFGQGRMRVRGDVRLAQRLLDAVARD